MDLCPICLEALKWQAVMTRCGHTFHPQCLASWARPTCPCCRAFPGPLEVTCPLANKMQEKLVAMDQVIHKIDVVTDKVICFALKVLLIWLLIAFAL